MGDMGFHVTDGLWPSESSPDPDPLLETARLLEQWAKRAIAQSGIIQEMKTTLGEHVAAVGSGDDAAAVHALDRFHELNDRLLSTS